MGKFILGITACISTVAIGAVICKIAGDNRHKKNMNKLKMMGDEMAKGKITQDEYINEAVRVIKETK